MTDFWNQKCERKSKKKPTNSFVRRFSYFQGAFVQWHQQHFNILISDNTLNAMHSTVSAFKFFTLFVRWHGDTTGSHEHNNMKIKNKKKSNQNSKNCCVNEQLQSEVCHRWTSLYYPFLTTSRRTNGYSVSALVNMNISKLI